MLLDDDGGGRGAVVVVVKVFERVQRVMTVAMRSTKVLVA